jgi:hypothetical protein
MSSSEGTGRSRLVRKWKANPLLLQKALQKRMRKEGSGVEDLVAESRSSAAVDARGVEAFLGGNFGEAGTHATGGSRGGADGAVVALRRGEMLAGILEKCAAVPKFWRVLEDIKYVKMFPCVCRATARCFSPTNTELPYWSVWTRELRPHTWNEMKVLMNFKRNDMKHIAMPEKVNPTDPRSARAWLPFHVWDYMVRVKYPDPATYAAKLARYRVYRRAHEKRLVTYTMRVAEKTGKMAKMERAVAESENGVVYAPRVGRQPRRRREQEEERAEGVEDAQSLFSSLVERRVHNGTQLDKIEAFEGDRFQIRAAFASALCGAGGDIPRVVFGEEPNCNDQESTFLPRRWNILWDIYRNMEWYTSPTRGPWATGDGYVAPAHQTSATVRTLSILYVGLKRHMKPVCVATHLHGATEEELCGVMEEEGISRKEALRVAALSCKEKEAMAKKGAVDLARYLHVWFKTRALTSLLNSLAYVGDLSCDHINAIAFSTPSAYEETMHRVARHFLDKYYPEAGTLVWGVSGIMTRSGDMVTLQKAVREVRKVVTGRESDA